LTNRTFHVLKDSFRLYIKPLIDTLVHNVIALAQRGVSHMERSEMKQLQGLWLLPCDRNDCKYFCPIT